MKMQKQVLFFLTMVMTIFVCPFVSIASSNESDVGISFTENESDEQENGISNQGKIVDDGGVVNGNKTSSKILPQTGEKRQSILLMLGLILLTASILVKITKKENHK